MWSNYCAKVCITYCLNALTQLEGLRSIIQCILVLAVCIAECCYGSLAGQVVDNLNGYVLLICVNSLNIQLVPTCTQLRETNTIAPIQQGCVLAILTWLNWLALLNDASYIHIDYLYVWSNYALEYIIAYYLAGVTNFHGCCDVIQSIFCIILTMSITSKCYCCLATQVVDNFCCYSLIIGMYVFDNHLIPTWLQVSQHNSLAPVQYWNISTWIIWS